MQRVVFGKASRSLNKQNNIVTPGPGDYALELDLLNSKSKGFSFGREKSRYNKKENNPSLGPGHYNVSNVWRLKHGVIGKQKRVLGSKINSTPGYYNIPSAIPNIAKYNYPSYENRKIRY